MATMPLSEVNEFIIEERELAMRVVWDRWQRLTPDAFERWLEKQVRIE